MPLVSVIILNFDGRRWLPACLDALASQQHAPDNETLVIDNGSTDGSGDLVRTSYPRVRVIDTSRNLGFAGGNNEGVRHARGEWIAFLNNDTIADPAWLARLWAAHRARPDCALITSRLVFMHDPDVVDSAGDGYLRAGGAFKHGHGAPASSFAESREVFGACGGAFMIRRDIFEKLGGFDERFFMVYEDVDLSYRARLAGLRVFYAADAIVRHAGSGSLGTISPAAVYYGQRNLEWTWIKNSPPGLLLRSFPSHMLYDLAGLIAYARAGHLGAWIRAKGAALAGLPSMLRKRRKIQGATALEPKSLWALMEPDWIGVKRREKAFAFRRDLDPAKSG